MNKALILLALKISGAICSILIGLVISRYYGAEYFAEFSLILTILNIGVIVSNWGAANYIIQNYYNHNTDFTKITIINTIIALTFILLVSFSKKHININYFFIAVFCIPFYSFLQTKASYLIMDHRQVENSVVNDFLKNFLLLLCFIIFWKINILDIVSVYYLYYIMIGSVTIALFILHVKKSSNSSLNKKAFFIEGAYITISLIVIVLLAQLDRFAINAFVDKNSLASYFLVYTLLSLTSLFSQSILSIFLPKISKAIKTENNDKLIQINHTYSKIILLFIIFQTIVFNILLKFIFQVYGIAINNRDYLVLNILMSGLLISSIFGIAITIASYSKYKKVLVIKQTVTLAIYLPLLFLMVKYYGIIGAAISYSLGQILIKFMMYRFYKNKEGLSFFFTNKAGA